MGHYSAHQGKAWRRRRRSRSRHGSQQEEPAGRIRIEAELVPYTWEEAREIQERLERGEHNPPTWDDVIP
jgi:hypothetical protein